MSISNHSTGLSEADRNKLQAFYLALGVVGDELSLPVLRALLAIAIRPGLSVNELADDLGVPQQSASRYASILLGRYESPVAKGTQSLITQEVNPNEPRKRALYLTATGSRQMLKLNQVLEKGEM